MSQRFNQEKRKPQAGMHQGRLKCNIIAPARKPAPKKACRGDSLWSPDIMNQRFIQEIRKSQAITVFILFFFIAPFIFQSCVKYIAAYDPIALNNAVSLKSKSLNLVNKATEPYTDHEKEILESMQELEQAYEYACSLPKNNISVRQWEVLKDPGTNLLGGFFQYWKQKEKLTQEFIDEISGEISRAFDTIIKLETLKNR
jgi:hypothetical protein